MDERPLVADGTTVEEATDRLLAIGVGDGLPVVPPTVVRCEAMLDGVADPGETLGAVPPLFGELSPAAAAYHAVLAGCRPGELPLVLAALRACLEPEFNLLGVQTTTGTAAVAVVVRGPVVAALGMTTGANLLGPGNRANASIGRAVALALTGIGGARPGETDMATTGQPGRYTFCLPLPPSSPLDRSPDPSVDRPPGSGPDGSPGAASGSAGAMPGSAGAVPGSAGGVPEGLASAPARRLPDGASSVTVLAVGGTAEVLPRGGGGTLAEILDPLADALAGAALAAGDPARMAVCEQAVVLPPEPADRLAALGATGTSVREHLYRRGNELLVARGCPGARVAVGPEAVHPLVTGGAGIKMLHLPGWIGGSRAATRAVPIG